MNGEQTNETAVTTRTPGRSLVVRNPTRVPTDNLSDPMGRQLTRQKSSVYPATRTQTPVPRHPYPDTRTQTPRIPYVRPPGPISLFGKLGCCWVVGPILLFGKIGCCFVVVLKRGGLQLMFQRHTTPSNF